MSGRPVPQMHHVPGIITIADANTTLGYCRHDPSGEVEYLFVHSFFRRRGYARRMLAVVEKHTGCRLHFRSPISPLGAHLVDAYLRGVPP